MNQTIDLAIIILNYNSQFWLKKTLDSLNLQYLKKTKYRVEVIVVDNQSTDNSIELIKNEFPWVKLIISDTNVGYAAGNNLALKQVTANFYLLLNNDVECTANSNFDLLINAFKAEKTIGIMTPKILLSNGQLDQACHRGEPTPWASCCYFLKIDRLLPLPLFANYHQQYKNQKTIHTIDACSGAAMMVRGSLINKVGLLDDRFFMYAEDLDWCKRFRENGMKVVFYPFVNVIHHKYKSGMASTSKSLAKKIHYYFYDTMLLYYDKHYDHKYPKIIRKILAAFLFIKKGGL